MVATRGRTFKRPWRRSCLSSKLKSSSAPIGRKDSWCFHAVGSSNAPLLGSTAAEGLPRIGRTSIATRWRSCALPQSASCSENFVIPPDVFGHTLRNLRGKVREVIGANIDSIVTTNPSLDRAIVLEPDGGIPLADRCVRMVVSDFTFEHIENPAYVARELDRILAPGGWICARTPNRNDYVSLAN